MPYVGRIVGADIVEYNPDRDVDNITASVASKIMKEIAGKIIVSQEAYKERAQVHLQTTYSL